MTNVHRSSLLRQSDNALPEQNFYNFDIDSEFLVYIYRSIIQLPKRVSLNAALQDLISAGTQKFNLSCGLLLRRLSSAVFDVAAFKSPDENLYVGKHFILDQLPRVAALFESHASLTSDTQQLYCPVILSKNDHSFIGVKFVCSCEQEYVLYFEQKTDKSNIATIDNELYIQLLAEGVAFMIDQDSALAQSKLVDKSISADGTVRSLEEYLEQAKIPETFGVPARVIEVLERRMGSKSLSISDVAEELNLSKRTLQRRLQQQDVNFADLRDKVRFNYSIDYLIKQHHSIDSISSLLDFSDRTSFTNAFKRWTGLSPSSFRKLFRDYV